MRLVLFIPDFVLQDRPQVLRACPIKFSADLCRRIGAAVARCHAVAEASAAPHFHFCADEDPTRVGLGARSEAMALAFVREGGREGRLEVRRATGGGVDGLVDTFVFTIDTYESAIASAEFRDAFLRHKRLPETTDHIKIRSEGFHGVLINLRLTPARGVGIESDQVEFAAGLPLYDAAGHVIDLRRYSVLGGIGRDGLKPAAELINQLAHS